MYIIDKENRRVIIKTHEEFSSFTTEKVISEFDKLERKFLDGTQDKYECELVILDVEEKDMITGEKIGITTKAFTRRIGQPNWLMEFNETEYVL